MPEFRCQCTYLGVTITHDLKWDTHINSICAKANRTLSFLRRNLTGCSKATKDTAIKTYLTPVLEYASTVWDPYKVSNVHRIEMIQRRAARFVCGIPWDQGATSVTETIKNSLKWPTLAQRRKQKRLLVFRDLLFGHPALAELRAEISPVTSNHNTRRNHDFCIFRPYCRTTLKKNSYLIRSIKEWNDLPHGPEQSKNIFKERLRQLI